MGIIGSYFLNGPVLATSTGIFTDEALTTDALDGYYSQGTVVRYLQSGILLPRQTCPSCATACPAAAAGVATLGVYLIPIELEAATGAVKVTFNPNTVPDGIRATYNGVVYNGFSAVLDGYHATSVSNGLTYMGDAAAVTGLVATHSLAEYELYDGAFTANGDTASVAVTSASVSTSSGDPGNCILYLPKTLSAPTTLLIEIVQAIGTEDPSWSLDVGCPAPITDTLDSTHVNPVDGCTTTAPYIDTIYLGKVSGTASVPTLYDWAFVDANAVQVKAVGDYKVKDSSDVAYLISVDADGLISAVIAC